MGLFGDNGTKEIEALNARLNAALKQSEERRKTLTAALAAEQQKTAGLVAKVEAGQIELEKMKVALLKTRQRQKASVERANRYKSRLATPETPATVNL